MLQNGGVGVGLWGGLVSRRKVQSESHYPKVVRRGIERNARTYRLHRDNNKTRQTGHNPHFKMTLLLFEIPPHPHTPEDPKPRSLNSKIRYPLPFIC